MHGDRALKHDAKERGGLSESHQCLLPRKPLHDHPAIKGRDPKRRDPKRRDPKGRDPKGRDLKRRDLKRREGCVANPRCMHAGSSLHASGTWTAARKDAMGTDEP